MRSAFSDCKYRSHFTLIFPFFVSILHLLNLCEIVASARAPKPNKIPPVIKLLGNFEAFIEMSAFLTDSLQNAGSLSCTTIIWDSVMSSVVDYIKFCPESEHKCPYKYMINFGDGNMSETLTKSLRAGYKEQCQFYIILLNRTALITDILHHGDDLRMINTRARFLIWYGDTSKNFETDEIWKKLPNVILFHTKLKRKPSRKRTSFTIMSFKWPLVSSSHDATHIIDFWRNGKLTKSGDTWYRDKTNDLKNITLRILVVEHPPSVIKYSSPDGYVEYAGTEIELIKELSTIMNFDFDLVDADPVTKWGGQIWDNNSIRHFYGAFAKLIYGETDMAIGSFLILKHYLDYLDMSIPLDVACTSFLTPNPLPRPRYLALILPFQFQLWMLVLTMCFIFAPVGLYLLTKLAIHATEYPIFREWSSIIFTSISIMSQVALHIWPRFWAVRMFIGGYWLFCLLVTLAYRGAMVSFLTIPLFEQPIDNLNDLEASGLRIGGWGTELRNLFVQKGAVDEYGAKALLSQKYETIGDYNTGISMVAEGKFALYENIRYLKFARMTRNLTKSGAPSMRIMMQCVVPVHIGLAYQKNSPISPTINRHIRRFQESGLMKRWSQRLITKTKQYYREKLIIESEEELNNVAEENGDKENQDAESDKEEENSGKQQRKERVLTILDLQGAIYLILFGMVASIGVFVGEILVAHTHAKHSTLNVNKVLMKWDDTTEGNDFEFPIQPYIRSFNLDYGIKDKKMSMKKINFQFLRVPSHKQNFIFEYLE